MGIQEKIDAVNKLYRRYEEDLKAATNCEDRGIYSEKIKALSLCLGALAAPADLSKLRRLIALREQLATVSEKGYNCKMGVENLTNIFSESNVANIMDEVIEELRRQRSNNPAQFYQVSNGAPEQNESTGKTDSEPFTDIKSTNLAPS